VLFFGADDGVIGDELWQTNGAVSGASLVRDINEGPGSSNPAGMSQRGTELLFRATAAGIGTELYRLGSVAPVLTLPQQSAPYLGSIPVRLAPQATVDDSDSPVLYGGQLTVSLGSTYRTQDQLIIATTSTVSISQSRVLVNGVVAGVIGYVNNGRDLRVLFTQNATLARVREVIRAVAFNSLSSQPVAGTRVARFELTDGDSGRSLLSDVNIPVL
jgi:ELWxxDGT repeat protein